MTSHVRQHEKTRTAGFCFCFEVIEINDKIVCDFDKNRLTPRVHNGAGDRRQRERIRQHLFTRFKASSLKGSAQGIAARSTGEAIFAALPGGVFCFQLRRLRNFTFGRVVTVESARTQYFRRGHDRAVAD